MLQSPFSKRQERKFWDDENVVTPKLSEHVTNNVLELEWLERKLSTYVKNLFSWEELPRLVPEGGEACLSEIIRCWFAFILLFTSPLSGKLYLHFFFLSWFPLTHYWILELTFQKRWMRNDCIYYLLAKQTKNSTYVTCSHCAMDVNGYIPGLNNFKSWNNFKQQTLDKKTLLTWKLFPSSLNCLYLSFESNIDWENCPYKSIQRLYFLYFSPLYWNCSTVICTIYYTILFKGQHDLRQKVDGKTSYSVINYFYCVLTVVGDLQNGELFLLLQSLRFWFGVHFLQAAFNICHVSGQKIRRQKALQRHSIPLRPLLG